MEENQMEVYDAQVAMSNEFSRAKLQWKPKDFDLLILYHAISQISKDDKDLKVYETPIAQLKIGKIVGAEYDRLFESVKRLTSAAFIFESDVKGKRRIKGKPIFSSIEYVEGQAYIKSEFNPLLKQHLLNLKAFFTLSQFQEFVRLPTNKCRTFFSFLKSWAGLIKKEVELEELHEILQSPKSCKENFFEFKRKVLDPAIKEINKNTSLKVSYIEKEKRAKKVVSLEFVFDEAKNLENKHQREFLQNEKINEQTKKFNDEVATCNRAAAKIKFCKPEQKTKCIKCIEIFKPSWLNLTDPEKQ